MSSNSTDPILLGEDSDGNELAAVPFWPDSEPADQKAFKKAAETPEVTPTTGKEGVGVLQRHLSGQHHSLQRVDPKEFALNSAELSTTIKKFRDEMYRNQFPVLVPAFEAKCTECGTEYEDETDECEICGHTEFAEPSPRQKRRAKRFFRSVNKESQSLRALMEYEEDYQSFRGVSIIVARKAYEKRRKGTQIGGTIIGGKYEAVPDTDAGPNGTVEFVHADSRVILPITDAQNRLGGAWICPFHREEFWEREEIEPGETTCPKCDTLLQEAGYAEVDGTNSDQITNLYLTDEVIDWARHFPEHNGLDGRSPVLPMIKLQAIVQFVREYEISVLNGENTDRLPNKFVVAYGPNVRQNLAASLDENSDKSAWETGEVYFDGPAEDVEIDIIDVTPGGVIENREAVIERQQSQIRAAFGVSDAMENELSDAGGLNAEGTQIEITNRAVASAHQDTEDKALSKIEDTVGLTDWDIKFVDPKREDNELTVGDKAQAIAAAQQAGIKWRISDGEVILPDQDSDDAEAPHDTEEADTGNPTQALDSDQKLSVDQLRNDPEAVAQYYGRRWSAADAEEACCFLEQAGQECLWQYEEADAKLLPHNSDCGCECATSPVDQKTIGLGNLPAIRSDDDVPDFAQELIDDAIQGGAIEKPQDLTNRQFLQLQNVVGDSLTQRNGWSIESIQRRLGPSMPDFSPDERRGMAINAVQNVINEARLLGYAVTDPPLDERWFYFAGPKNANICEACLLLLNETNPSHGGTPMRWNELVDRMDEVNSEFFGPGMDNHGAHLHSHCAHTTSEYREGRGDPRSELP